MKPQNEPHQPSLTARSGMITALFCCIFLFTAHVARSQVTYNGTGLSYTQNFDSLGTNTASWTDNSTLPGWYLNSTVEGVPTTLAVSTGNNSSGNAFNLGVAGTDPITDRALGWLTTSTVGTGYIGVQLQNESGQNYVGDVSITLTIEQWSARNVNSDPVFIDYKANLISTGNQLTSTSWTQLDSIASPNLSNTGGGTTHYIDGNAPGNFATVTETVDFTSGTPWNAGSFLWFRTRDQDISGNNDMNGIDNVSINISPVPEPSVLALAGMGLAVLLMIQRCRRAEAVRLQVAPARSR
jgi:hypothetical protein